MESKIFVEIFNDLLEENALNKKQFAQKSGIPYTTVMGWTKLNRLPDFTALIKIADFFHCSIDYLTGRQDEFGNSTFTEEDLMFDYAFIKYFRKLDENNRRLIIELTKKLAKSQ